jgi:hypothetical protein
MRARTIGPSSAARMRAAIGQSCGNVLLKMMLI